MKKILKKIQKTFEKPLDKAKRMWYNKRVAAKKATVTNLSIEKEVEKNLKKF